MVNYYISKNLKTSMTAIRIFSNSTKIFSTKARNTEPLENELYTRNDFMFLLVDSTQIHLDNTKTRNFYALLNQKTHTVHQTCPMNWNNITRLDENEWKIIFTSLKGICKETKLKEFQFKLIHRIELRKRSFIDMVLKRIMNVSCGEKDSIEHSFLNCRFVKIFVNNVINWFNAATTQNLLQQPNRNYLASYQAHIKRNIKEI